MMFKRFETYLLIRVVLLSITLSVTIFFLVKGWFVYSLCLLPLVMYQFYNFYLIQVKIHKELKDFVEAIKYKDFSRYFEESKSSVVLYPLRKSFNIINKSFHDISKEKETQYQYLQRILELVDTGILSYEEPSGKVVWINEALKQILQVSFLKNIQLLIKRQGDLYQEIISLHPGDSKIFEMRNEKNISKVLISVTAFQTNGKRYKLLAFQNVNEVLDETEANAWQKLLSVLTHEIMNSIAPISSLADTLKSRIQDLESMNGRDSVEDLSIGMEAIKRRSEGLLKFAQTYRNLNKIANPNFQMVSVKDIFENLNQLMLPTLLQKNIDLQVRIKETKLSIMADNNLLEQVLINLLLNAMDAVKNRPDAQIILSADQSPTGKIMIIVADNGPGISEEVLDKIFIPFFTTKKNGSGIGLTLCKQIMRLHKGNIQVKTQMDQGTKFILLF